MTAIPTGISEAHEVEVHLTCGEGLHLVPEQLVDRITRALREARAALIDYDHEYASAQVVAVCALVDSIELDGGACSFEGTVEGVYLDDETAEAVCPECGTIHEVPL